ncbi:MAG TPA: hypothetical protein VF855_00570 [Acidimicrobiales bacterium]
MPAVLGAAVVAIVVAAIAGGGGEGSVERPDRATSTTFAASFSGSPTTAPGAVADRFTPPFGLPAGVVLVGLTDDGRRVSSRLAFGEVLTRPVDELEDVDQIGAQVPGFAVDSFAVFRNGPGIVVPADIDEPMATLGPYCAVLGPVESRVWVAVSCPPGPAGPPMIIQRVPVAGLMHSTPIELPSVAEPRGGDGRGGLLLATDAGTYLIDADGHGPDLLTRNRLLAVGADITVELACDEQLQCHVQVVDRDTGVVRTLPAPSGADRPLDLEGGLSPDGRWMVLPDPLGENPSAGVLLEDLATGEAQPIDAAVSVFGVGDVGSTALVWTPDSSWILWVDRRGGLRAMEMETRTVHYVGERTALDKLSSFTLVPLSG